MKYFHPISMYTLPRGGLQRGGTRSAGSEGPIPPAGGSGGMLRTKDLNKKEPQQIYKNKMKNLLYYYQTLRVGKHHILILMEG